NARTSARAARGAGEITPSPAWSTGCGESTGVSPVSGGSCSRCHALYDAHERSRSDEAPQPKTRALEPALEVGGTALADFGAHHHHLHVGDRPDDVARVALDHELDDEQAMPRLHGAPDVAQDRQRARVVPVVQDVLEQVRVAPLGHALEEVAR